MSGYEKLGVGYAVHALNIKVIDMQRELVALRQDMRRVLFLLESQRAGTQVSDQSASEDVEPEPELHIAARCNA